MERPWTLRLGRRHRNHGPHHAVYQYIAILFTQVAADDPVAPGPVRDFWRYAAGA